MAVRSGISVQGFSDDYPITDTLGLVLGSIMAEEDF